MHSRYTYFEALRLRVCVCAGLAARAHFNE